MSWSIAIKENEGQYELFQNDQELSNTGMCSCISEHYDSFLSHLSYCTTAWSQTSQTTLKPVQRLYNRALKILDEKPIRFHHCYILSKHKIFNFVNFINFRHINLFSKCLTGLAPEPLCKFVNRLEPSRSTRATTHGDCKVPFF